MEANQTQPDTPFRAEPTIGWARWEPWVFGALVLAQLIPIWAVAHLPTQDGPSHLANADIIRRYYLPGGQPLRQYYMLIARPIPNLSGHLIMGALLFALPPVLAEKLLASLCLVLLPVAARYALGAIRPGSKFLAYLVFPFGYSWLFQLGFYNFSLGVGLFFLLIGYWAKHRSEMTWRRAAALGGLALLLHLSHLGAAAPALGILVALVIFFTIADWRTAAETQKPAIDRNTALTLAALGPGLLLAAYYSWRMGIGHTGGPPAGPRWLMAVNLLDLEVLVSHANAEHGPAIATALLFAVLVIGVVVQKLRRRSFGRWDILVGVVALLVVMFFRAGTEQLARLFVAERMNILAFMVLLLWLAAWNHGRIVARAIVLLGGSLALLVVAINTATYLRLDPYLTEYTSVAQSIEPGSAFVVAVYQPKGMGADNKPLSLNISPFLHASGYIAAERHAIDLSNYEGHAPHFAVRWRDGQDPLRIMNRVESKLDDSGKPVPPSLQLAHYEAVTGRKIDYVLLWWRQGNEDDADTVSLLGELAARYELIETSRPRGLMKVYRRK